MTDSNINAEQQATNLLTKLLREHAMEVKLVGGFIAEPLPKLLNWRNSES